jgi:hypothetical protein
MKNAVFWDMNTQLYLTRKNYVSATENGQLMLCKIWGFHSSEYEKKPSSGIWRPVTLVRTDVSEERIPSIICVTRIGELGITLAVTSNRVSVLLLLVVLTRATRRHIPEDWILHADMLPFRRKLTVLDWHESFSYWYSHESYIYICNVLRQTK